MAIDFSLIPQKKIRTLTDIEDQVRTVKLPQGSEWFDCSGHVLFPMISLDGSLVSTGISILLEKMPLNGASFGRHGLHREFGGKWFTIEFSPFDNWHDVNAKFKQAFDKLRANDGQ